MNRKVIDRDWLTEVNLCKIGVFNKSSVHQNYKSRTNRSHGITVDIKPGIFSQTDSQRPRVVYYRLKESADSAPLNKMRIYDHVFYKS